ASSAPSIRRFRSASCDSTTTLFPVGDDGVGTLAAEHGGQTAVAIDREYQNGNVIFTRQRDGGGVHHFEVARQDLEIGQLVIALGAAIDLGIGVVDAVDLGPLEDCMAAHLGRAERRRSVGGEEGV